jgi:tryptophan synthase alpha chain
MLESYIREKLAQKDILLMTHIVMGYPSFSQSMQVVEQMVEAGVDLMELQIPFSEPMADGPVILKANQAALENGATVAGCLEFAEKAAARFDIPFLIMSYANILFKYGMEPFAARLKKINVKGAIVPDIPPEEGREYIKTFDDAGLCPVFLFSPQTTDDRMRHVASHGRGFIYCVARKGVTGNTTQFSEDLTAYLARCRRATNLPLAVGFGVRDKSDIGFLSGKADIAVIGSETIRVVAEKGVEACGSFIRELTAPALPAG